MNDPLREFLIWVDFAPRTYADAMCAWQSHCPRFTVWEDALEQHLVQVCSDRVVLTPSGQAALGLVSAARRSS